MLKFANLAQTRFVLCVVALATLALLSFHCIEMVKRGPYPTDPDEAYLADHAWEIAKTGDLNPHFFAYGSLPIYVTSASLGIAAHLAKLRGEIATIEEVEPVSFPYYGHPSISYVPRFAFALIGAVALFAVSWLGWTLRSRYTGAFVPWLVLAFYPLFQRHAFSYLNTDIVVTALSASALLYLSRTYRSRGLCQRVLVPALFCGATLATKYNGGLLVLPFALAIPIQSRDRRALLQLSQLAFATTLVFLVCEPFALLDAQNFAADVLREAEHYRTGHRGHEGEPGLPMLRFHLTRIRRWQGWVASALIGLGIARGFVVDPKRTALLVSYPLASLLFMSMQRVNFERNLLPAAACLMAFSGLGLEPVEILMRRVALRAAARWPRLRRNDATLSVLARGATGLVLLAALASARSARPQGKLAHVVPDSRREISDWLSASTTQEPCHLLIADSLGLNPADLAPRCTVEPFTVTPDLTPAALARRLRQLAAGRKVYLALPRWRDDVASLNGVADALALGSPLFEAGFLPTSCLPVRTFGDPFVAVHRLATND